MASTYWIDHKTEYHVPTVETVLSSPNVPYIEQAAVLGIMNNHGSDSIISIRDIQINEIIGRTTTALTNLGLYRITALTGGVAVPTNKYDSSASNLPIQVSIIKYPNSVTTTGDYLRRMLSMTGLSMTTALMGHFGMRGRATMAGGLNLNHIFVSGDADTQAYVLREGEGIGIRTTLTSPQNYPVEITVHFSNGTDTFCINEIVNVQSATELFAILNGSGSGVVLYVSRIEMRLVRTSDIYRVFNIESCSGVFDGDVITPTSMDTTNASVDSLVDFRANCIVRQGNLDARAGRNARMGGDMIPFRRVAMPCFGKGVALASGALGLMPLQQRTFSADKVNSSGEIVLREGEGLCVLQKYNSAGWGDYSINVLFTVVDNGGAVSGGEHSYVF